jgi:hypothetical protein
VNIMGGAMEDKSHCSGNRLVELDREKKKLYV